ncbi:hypothetical protein [Reichenbachiella sp. MALMAid0571]|uniref:hypothetical protein n=1 Tax=Reichenbachiella sp. MALMAid0571 TaxID=3143939 RepID=UPI0032DF00DB
MDIYCIEEFKKEFEQLISKKNYRSLTKDIIEYFFDKNIDGLKSGTRLNNNDETPYIKKRIGGRGGFRLYFLLIIRKESLYLLFVHPKTGPDGSQNITDEAKAKLYKRVLECIKSNFLYRLEVEGNKLKFVDCKVKP